MKYSASQTICANAHKVEALTKFNIPLLREAVCRINQGQEVPSELLEKARQLTKRAAKFKLISYDEFCELFPSRILPCSTAIEFGEVDRKTGFPIAFVYSPELADYVEAKYRSDAIQRNLERLRKLVESDRRDLHFTAEMEEFIANELPFNLPFKVHLNGDKWNVLAQASLEWAKLFANKDVYPYLQEGIVPEDTTIFAVIYMNENGEEVLSFFLKECEEYAKKNNLGRITRFFESDRRICKLKVTEELQDFILQELPVNIPFTIMCEGQDEKVWRLLRHSGSILYAKKEDQEKLLSEDYHHGDVTNIFAVKWSKKDEQEVLTFFIKEYDYVSDFAVKFARICHIPDDVAMKISQHLEHDIYYALKKSIVTSDFESFVTSVAKYSKVEEGETLKDYYSGEELPIIIGAFSHKLALDADDEVPCCVLIGNRLNVYLPSNLMEEAEA